MNFEWKFSVFALNLMTWFQEKVQLLAPSSFRGIKYTSFGTWSLFKKGLIDSSITPDG